jgi:hypothetical protein
MDTIDRAEGSDVEAASEESSQASEAATMLSMELNP